MARASGERAPAFTAEELEKLVEGVLPQYTLLYGPPDQQVSAHQKKDIWCAIAKDVRTLGVHHRQSTHCRKRWEDIRRWSKKTAEAQLGMASQRGRGARMWSAPGTRAASVTRSHRTASSPPVKHQKLDSARRERGKTPASITAHKGPGGSVDSVVTPPKVEKGQKKSPKSGRSSTAEKTAIIPAAQEATASPIVTGQEATARVSAQEGSPIVTGQEATARVSAQEATASHSPAAQEGPGSHNPAAQ
ncbi:hypothetical protein NDU88_011513 [Pleurodeles waltl]|uniref:Myb/SANT-like DNA-binding domain-containing protein n=1 Tax=Pleurodeles waltl TaxID=8319 RepID=A0AAV7R072_PLEWA|nr:hypothetical protein NDU88_011513 [Pleurodeles waltl]